SCGTARETHPTSIERHMELRKRSSLSPFRVMKSGLSLTRFPCVLCFSSLKQDRQMKGTAWTPKSSTA
ncbi:hypothetical protein, partial [Ellagibacter isourolithinifaciens]|uniref:hypothetical protein n=1 Tax=Ellagibacter isourolithinifaciens TaxID=2137581 RepID=UPI003A8D7677